MPKIGTEKLIDELFELEKRKDDILQCPKCKSSENFSTASMAIAVAMVDKNKRLLEIKDLVINFDESLWQCESCNCVFDESLDIII